MLSFFGWCSSCVPHSSSRRWRVSWPAIRYFWLRFPFLSLFHFLLLSVNSNDLCKFKSCSFYLLMTGAIFLLVPRNVSLLKIWKYHPFHANQLILRMSFSDVSAIISSLTQQDTTTSVNALKMGMSLIWLLRSFTFLLHRTMIAGKVRKSNDNYDQTFQPIAIVYCNILRRKECHFKTGVTKRRAKFGPGYFNANDNPCNTFFFGRENPFFVYKDPRRKTKEEKKNVGGKKKKQQKIQSDILTWSFDDNYPCLRVFVIDDQFLIEIKVVVIPKVISDVKIMEECKRFK